ncbi:MAG TPA: tRNA lysidine(34) synthetase TilS [Edaphocola sp.]|nr:tRNA lysidine(34) synthetase TilS [Edaphocola sp.]
MLFNYFLKQLQQYNWHNSKIIIAVSGGLDSMSLALLFLEATNYFKNRPDEHPGFKIAIAHCNFQLRGESSDLDAVLVKEWAENNNVPFFQQDFDTKKIIEQEGDNVQIVARKLRYDWFADLLSELNFDFIATAHHLEDSVETLLMNFFKGTGIAGVHGILAQQNKIIRPLLPFTKEALKEYALSKNLIWREDVSNQKTDYLRNKIRLELIPEIEKVFPNAKQSLYQNSLRFAEVEALYHQSIAQYRKKLLEKRKEEYYISLRKLENCKPIATICLELLKPFGLQVAQIPDVLKLIKSESGKFIQLPNWKLIKDRRFFILAKNKEAESTLIVIEEAEKKIIHNDFVLKIAAVKEIPPKKQIKESDLFIDKKLLSFPLYLRPWREGDYFYPLGMDMKKKKVKKVLIDMKMPIHEKEKVWVIESAKKIVWLCGIRADERFKVDLNTQEMLHLQFENK